MAKPKPKPTPTPTQVRLTYFDSTELEVFNRLVLSLREKVFHCLEALNVLREIGNPNAHDSIEHIAGYAKDLMDGSCLTEKGAHDSLELLRREMLEQMIAARKANS